MNHWIALPIVLPAFAGIGIILGARRSLGAQRFVGLTATLGLVAVAVVLLRTAAEGAPQVYALGNWSAPFGIVMVLDRLSAWMVMLTALTALGSQLYALAGSDAQGANYHALFQFQLMGLCGAFLTGDIFNLFVFFEVLLIASYGLLLHGGGRDRVRAGIHYVVFNLAGSALFLIGVGIIYGLTGTLNMADLAQKVPAIAPESAAVLSAGALILLVVFAVKAALLPLGFWLPLTYGSAAAPVAALFAIMTKVGVYAIVRVYSIVFGAGAGPLADLAVPFLLPLALLTLVVATIGAAAARSLRGAAAYLVIASVGTMLTAFALGTPASLGATLYYMGHSTFVLAAMFLLIDLIARQRGDAADGLTRAGAVAQPALLGGLFLAVAVAVSGLPPLSGFIGKVLVLNSAVDQPSGGWIYGVVLVTGLVALIALSRAGSMVFWNIDEQIVTPEGKARPLRVAALVFLLAIVVAMTVFAGPIVDYTNAAAEGLVHPDSYVEAVLHDVPHVPSMDDAHGGAP